MAHSHIPVWLHRLEGTRTQILRFSSSAPLMGSQKLSLFHDINISCAQRRRNSLSFHSASSPNFHIFLQRFKMTSQTSKLRREATDISKVLLRLLPPKSFSVQTLSNKYVAPLGKTQLAFFLSFFLFYILTACLNHFPVHSSPFPRDWLSSSTHIYLKANPAHFNAIYCQIRAHKITIWSFTQPLIRQKIATLTRMKSIFKNHLFQPSEICNLAKQIPAAFRAVCYATLVSVLRVFIQKQVPLQNLISALSRGPVTHTLSA